MKECAIQLSLPGRICCPITGSVVNRHASAPSSFRVCPGHRDSPCLRATFPGATCFQWLREEGGMRSRHIDLMWDTLVSFVPVGFQCMELTEWWHGEDNAIERRIYYLHFLRGGTCHATQGHRRNTRRQKLAWQVLISSNHPALQIFSRPLLLENPTYYIFSLVILAALSCQLSCMFINRQFCLTRLCQTCLCLLYL